MSTAHAAAPSLDALLREVDRLDDSQLRPFISQLLYRAAHRLAPHLEGRESELLEAINRGLPADSETRYRELVAARQKGILQPDELAELKNLSDQAEKLQAERVAHLVDLARLRNVPLAHLMSDLGIEPAPVE